MADNVVPPEAAQLLGGGEPQIYSVTDPNTGLVVPWVYFPPSDTFPNGAQVPVYVLPWIERLATGDPLLNTAPQDVVPYLNYIKTVYNNAGATTAPQATAATTTVPPAPAAAPAPAAVTPGVTYQDALASAQTKIDSGNYTLNTDEQASIRTFINQQTDITDQQKTDYLGQLNIPAEGPTLDTGTAAPATPEDMRLSISNKVATGTPLTPEESAFLNQDAGLTETELAAGAAQGWDYGYTQTIAGYAHEKGMTLDQAVANGYVKTILSDQQLRTLGGAGGMAQGAAEMERANLGMNPQEYAAYQDVISGRWQSYMTSIVNKGTGGVPGATMNLSLLTPAEKADLTLGMQALAQIPGQGLWSNIGAQLHLEGAAFHGIAGGTAGILGLMTTGQGGGLPSEVRPETQARLLREANQAQADWVAANQREQAYLTAVPATSSGQPTGVSLAQQQAVTLAKNIAAGRGGAPTTTAPTVPGAGTPAATVPSPTAVPTVAARPLEPNMPPPVTTVQRGAGPAMLPPAPAGYHYDPITGNLVPDKKPLMPNLGGMGTAYAGAPATPGAYGAAVGKF